jgi:hypothetical protein
MPTYYAVYSTSDGKLNSIGTKVVTPLPEGFAFVALDHNLDAETEYWDETTRTVKPFYVQEYVDARNQARVLKLKRPVTNQDIIDAQMPYLSKFQFMQLFTLAELGKLLSLESADVPDDVKVNGRIAQMAFQIADYITLTNPLIAATVQSFETYGLLDPGRAAQILAGQLPQQ